MKGLQQVYVSPYGGDHLVDLDYCGCSGAAVTALLLAAATAADILASENGRGTSQGYSSVNNGKESQVSAAQPNQGLCY